MSDKAPILAAAEAGDTAKLAELLAGGADIETVGAVSIPAFAIDLIFAHVLLRCFTTLFCCAIHFTTAILLPPQKSGIALYVS